MSSCSRVRATAAQEEGDIRANLERDSMQIDVERVHRLKSPQRGGRVRAGAPHPRPGRYLLVKVDADRQGPVGGALERAVRADHRVVHFAHAKAGRGERRLLRGNEFEQIVEGDRLEGRPQLVKSVRVAPDDLEVEVELRARGQRDAQITPRTQRLRLEFARTPRKSA